MTNYKIKNQRKNESVRGYKLKKKRSEEGRKYERSIGVKSDNDC
jgi:hypothetical protein